MRPATSNARKRRAARRRALRQGGTASWRPVGTRWPQPATGLRTPEADQRGVQVRGTAKKGTPTRSRRRKQRKRRFSSTQLRRYNRYARMVDRAHARSAWLQVERTGLQVMRRSKRGRWLRGS